MADDDDLIFADTADDALNKTGGIKPLQKKKGQGNKPLGPASARTRRRPPPELAGRPHCLESPVLPEPLLLSRSKKHIIGRDEGVDVRIRSDKVSGEHAEVFWDGKSFMVADLGSTNGTELNDRQIPAKQNIPLHDGDRLSFGGYEVTVNALQPGEFPEEDLGGKTRKMKRVQ